jgi:hypothetical protein
MYSTKSPTNAVAGLGAAPTDNYRRTRITPAVPIATTPYKARLATSSSHNAKQTRAPFSAASASAASVCGSVRAYFEWMPIRQVDTDDKLRIWRSFKVGKLLWARLYLLAPFRSCVAT